MPFRIRLAPGIRLSIGKGSALIEELSIAHHESRFFVTDYPYHPRARPLELSAGGQSLLAQFSADEDQYIGVLQGFTRFARHIRSIPVGPLLPGDRDPCWINDWLSPLDAISIYGLIASLAPRRYVEIGSGNSTRFARQAISDHGLKTQIVSIDPEPRAEVDAIADRIVRQPLEQVEAEFWSEIQGDDMLFVDNSHRCLSNSDVTVFFLEILPALPPQTVFGFHDIFFSFDYPEGWMGRYYN